MPKANGLKAEDAMCEAFLSIYSKIDTLIIAIDKQVLSLCSHSYNRNIFAVYDKVIKLINEKRSYAVIKRIVDNAFAVNLNNVELRYKYKLNYSLADIERIFDKSHSSCSHKIIRQRKKIFDYIQKRYSLIQMLNIAFSSGTIMQRYKVNLKRGFLL